MLGVVGWPTMLRPFAPGLSIHIEGHIYSSGILANSKFIEHSVTFLFFLMADIGNFVGAPFFTNKNCYPFKIMSV